LLKENNKSKLTDDSKFEEMVAVFQFFYQENFIATGTLTAKDILVFTLLKIIIKHERKNRSGLVMTIKAIICSH
jgi:hypothetical protein